MNRFTKTLLFIHILFVSIVAQAQNELIKFKGEITGIVQDSISNEKLEYATLQLIDNLTNKIVNGEITDIAGKFKIKNIKNGTYKLKINAFGYSPKIITLLEITDNIYQIDLRNINVNSFDKTTKEVVITGQKDLIEEKVDRTVYNAENDASNKGGDASEVLRKVPMLSVDLDGNVSMRGSSNVRVLINNKPSTITAGSVADALKQIPADQIKSVEVITSPSAKYDAEGSAGIINIILKSNSSLNGYSFNVDVSAGVRGSGLGLNGAYRKNKFAISLGGRGRSAYNIPGNFENIQITNASVKNYQTANTLNERLFGNYNLGIDYEINKKNTVSVGAKIGARNNNSWQNNLNTITTDLINNTATSTFRKTTTADLSNTIDVNLNYTHTTNVPQREFSFLSLYSKNNRTNDFLSTLFDTINTTSVSSRLKNLNTSTNEELTFQLDYQTPVRKIDLLEFGGKNISRTVTSDYNYQNADGIDGLFVKSTNSQLSNNFNYKQNINAAYVSYTLALPKNIILKAGTRYEHTSITANYGEGKNNNIPSYDVLVPSLNLSKKLKLGMVKASYNRRIQRPSIQFLNPNFQTTNPLSISVGNPNLSPEYSNNYEIAFSTMAFGTNLSLAGYVKNTNNAIQGIKNNLGDTILTTYANIGKEDAYGFNLFLNTTLKKLTINGGVDGYYAVLNNNNPDKNLRASNTGWVFNYRAMGSYKLPKNWSLQLFGFYRGKKVLLQGYQTGFGIYSLSLKKDFWNKKVNIGFGAENFFTPSFRFNNQIISPIITQNSTNTIHNINFKVNFGFTIGGLKDIRKKKVKSINNDDLKNESDNMDNNSSSGNGGGNLPQSQNPNADNANKFKVKPIAPTENSPKKDFPETKKELIKTE